MLKHTSRRWILTVCGVALASQAMALSVTYHFTGGVISETIGDVVTFPASPIPVAIDVTVDWATSTAVLLGGAPGVGKLSELHAPLFSGAPTGLGLATVGDFASSVTDNFANTGSGSDLLTLPTSGLLLNLGGDELVEDDFFPFLEVTTSYSFHLAQVGPGPDFSGYEQLSVVEFAPLSLSFSSHSVRYDYTLTLREISGLPDPVVPESATLLLLSIGGLALAARKARRSRMDCA